MALVIISDTHLSGGGRVLPEECLALLRAAEVIVHAGDISTVAALRQLTELGPPVHAVAGNVDEPALQASLPQELEFEYGGVRIGVVHDGGPARGRLERLRERFAGTAAVIFGHSHLPLHERDQQGFQIFNPGSPTQRRRAPRHTIGLARSGPGGLRFEHVALALPAPRRRL